MLGTCARATVDSFSVCVCVCYQSSASIRRVCNILNLPMKSLLNFEGFQLLDFAKKLSF